MLWIDTHYPATDPHALAALAVIMVTAHQGNNFWLAQLSPMQEALPHNLRLNIARWVKSYKIRLNKLNVLDI